MGIRKKIFQKIAIRRNHKLRSYFIKQKTLVKSRNSKIIKSQNPEIKELKALFKRFEKFLKQGILRIEERVENIEDGQKEIKEGQKRLETKADNLEITLDGFVGRVDDLTADNEVGTEHYRIHENKIDDHEKRIAKIETTSSS